MSLLDRRGLQAVPCARSQAGCAVLSAECPLGCLCLLCSSCLSSLPRSRSAQARLFSASPFPLTFSFCTCTPASLPTVTQSTTSTSVSLQLTHLPARGRSHTQEWVFCFQVLAVLDMPRGLSKHWQGGRQPALPKGLSLCWLSQLRSPALLVTVGGLGYDRPALKPLRRVHGSWRHMGFLRLQTAIWGKSLCLFFSVIVSI